MKKDLVGLLILLLTFCAYAQKDVTQFLGIPVDGAEKEMIKKLKAKGFEPHQNDPSILKGRFNGATVDVFVVTNNEKVCRVMLSDKNLVGERDIQARFNSLCQQFKNNQKYILDKPIEEMLINEDEDISYEMSVHGKRYEAVFYQRPINDPGDPTDPNNRDRWIRDSIQREDRIKAELLSKYTKEELENPTETTNLDISMTRVRLLWEDVNKHIEAYLKKPVWFIISEFNGKYGITMFYDNEYNRAHGEDL